MMHSVPWPISAGGDIVPSSTVVYCFDNFELHGELGELKYQGQPVQIRAKPLALLQYLVTHHARVVSAGELMSSVWPDVVVSHWALSSALRDLRRALSSRGVVEPVVRTQRGRGYQLRIAVTVRGTRCPVRAEGLEPLCCASSDHLLLVASLLGGSFEVETLARLVGRPYPEVMQQLDRAVAAGVIQRRVDQRVRYALGSAEVRESLHAMHSDAQRLRAHRLIARGLEALQRDTSKTKVLPEGLGDAASRARVLERRASPLTW